MKTITNCPITGDFITPKQKTNKVISYDISFQDEVLTFNFCENCFDKIDFERYRHVILGLLHNKKLPIKYDQVIHWGKFDENRLSKHFNVDLEQILNDADYPKTPKAKLDNLFSFFFENQTQDGQRLNFTPEKIFAQLYFKGVDELMFYTNTLIKNDLITGSAWPDSIQIVITFAGLQYSIKVFDEGELSNKVFIAMAFDETTKPIRKAIVEALKETGFDPIIIDEQHISSDRTINDEIIVKIRQSKFVIADFCLHRNGVYFESGFALGLGKKVIYTCSKAEFSKAHFDIKPLQTLLYYDASDLRNQLIYKIQAWIK